MEQRDEFSSIAGSLGVSSRRQIATQPPAPEIRTTRGVPREGARGASRDLRNQQRNSAVAPATRYDVTVEEQERTRRDATLAYGSSSGSGSSWSGGSHGSHHSIRSRRSHGSGHAHRSRRRSRHRTRLRGLLIRCTLPKFKCGGAAPIKLRRRAFQRYQKLVVAEEAAREPAYTVSQRA